MLTDEQRYENQMKYIELLSRLNVDLTSLTQYLNSINYFEAPATAQYQRAYAGGLCEQALKMCYELGQLCNAYFPGRYTDADIITVALLSGIYRAEMYEVYQKNVKNDITGQWEATCAYRTREIRPFYGELGFSSYMSVKNLIPLTDEQIEAIMYGSSVAPYTVDIHDILKQYPLVALTRMAEMATNYFEVS